jgi:hypothetical protein
MGPQNENIQAVMVDLMVMGTHLSTRLITHLVRALKVKNLIPKKPKR